MRDKLNNSPMAQVGVVLVLVVLAFVMLKAGGGSGGGGGEEAAAPTEATVAVAGTEATGTAVGATPGEAVEGAIESAGAELASGAAGPVPVPTPPLPAPVAAAYDANKTVVLLLVHDGGIDDHLVAESTRRLEAFPEAAVFIVPAKQVAHYGAITIGVDVQQVPALIVMRPRKLSGGHPQASVTYGFQTAEGIEQAMRDASYNGPAETYHPN